ncbi:MAG: preprotein translocase subunit SecE [Mycobacteriaceae bacterium]
MSDELDTAAGNGSDDTVALTQPLRPTGKRTRQRTGGTALAEVEDLETTALELGLGEDDDDGEGTKKAKAADSGSTRNPFVFVWNYLKQVVAELRKVIWPNRKQMINYTAVVLVFLIFMVSLIGGVDLGLAKLVLLVFG